MKRRLLAVAVALVLAAVGAAVLFSYVAGADRRAMAGMTTQTVLVVKTRVPAGTTADELAALVERKALPKVAVASGAVSAVSQLEGLVATADLEPGEQLLSARFVDPATLANTRPVQVPPGLQEVALLLEAQRALGGSLQNGATVGVLLSVDKQTHLSFHRVLVTQVQGGVPPVAAGGDATPAPSASAAPQGSVMVTLAVTPRQAERIVFAAENGTVWLSRDNPASSTRGTRVIDAENLYR